MKLTLILLAIVTCSTTTITECAFTCPDGRCNEHLTERLCSLDDIEIASKFASNSTKLWIGNSMNLNAGYTRSEQMSHYCALERLASQGTVLPGVSIDFVFSHDRNAVGIEAGLCFGRAGVNMVVGPGSSSVGKGLATVGKVLSFHIMGVHTSDPGLANKDSVVGYPTFSRVFPSDTFQGAALVTIVKSQGWERVAAITTSGSAYADGMLASFSTAGSKQGIRVVKATSVSAQATDEETVFALQTIKTSGVRVILLFPANSDHAFRIIELANTLGMVGEGWTYLGSENWVGKVSDMTNPTLAHGVLGTSPAVRKENNVEFDFLRDCQRAHWHDTVGKYANLGSVDDDLSTLEPTFWDVYAYDGVLAAVHVIHQVGLENISDMEAVRTAVNQVNFVGATGKVSFDTNGDRVGSLYEVRNIQGDSSAVSSVTVGLVDDEGIQFSSQIQFYGGVSNPPPDFIMQCNTQQNYNISVTEECDVDGRLVTFRNHEGDSVRYCPVLENEYVACTYPIIELSTAPLIIVAIGLVITVASLLLLLKFWHHKVIVRGQKQWLLVLVVGALLVQLSPLPMLGTVSVMSCSVPTIMLLLGSTTVVATLLLKTWRVGKIFGGTSSFKKVTITNSSLAKRFLGIVLASVSLVAIMLVQEPPNPVLVPKVSGQITYSAIECQPSPNFTSMMILFVGGLVFVLCAQSFKVRNVAGDFQEAWFVFCASYNSAFCACAAIGAGYGISGITPQQLFAVFSVLSTVGALGNIVLVLGPKFRAIITGAPLASEMSGSTTTRGVKVSPGSTAGTVGTRISSAVPTK